MQHISATLKRVMFSFGIIKIVAIWVRRETGALALLEEIYHQC